MLGHLVAHAVPWGRALEDTGPYLTAAHRQPCEQNETTRAVAPHQLRLYVLHVVLAFLFGEPVGLVGHHKQSGASVDIDLAMEALCDKARL